MTATRWILWILTLAAAFGLGRFTAALPQRSEFSTVDSFREALEDRDWLTRTYRLSAFLQDLNPENLPEALEALEARMRFVSDEELRLFMLAWSRFDAETAFGRALVLPPHLKRRASMAAMYAWGYRDPHNARVALRLVEDDAALTGALRDSLVSGWVRGDDKSGVIEYVASLPAGLPRQKLTNTLAAELIEQGPEAVMAWAEGIRDDAQGDYKRVVFEKASNALAAVDPLQAVSWIEGHLDRDFAAGAPVLIVRRWVESGSPVAAIDWALSLDAGAVRDDAFTAAFSRWLTTEPEEAEDWLRTAAPAPGLDSAVRNLMRRSFRSEPEIGVEWAQRIHDPEVRERVLFGVARYWMQEDPEAAKAWLAESGLSEQMKSALLKPPLTERRPPRARRGPRAPRAAPIRKAP
jgi:hypothetical protein